jgi:uncharacterized protein
MNELVVALGLVCVIEGLLWALSPALATRILTTVAKVPELALRLTGTAVVAVGVFFVWVGRG